MAIQSVNMDYLEQDSETSSLPNDDQQLERYHKLFKNYKQIKESIQRQSNERDSSKKSMGSVQKVIQMEEQKNLETRLSYTEKQYSKARENNILLLKKLSEAEETTQYLKFELEKAKRERAEEVQELKHEINRLKSENQYSRQKEEYEEKERISIEIHEMSKQLDLKDKEINRLLLKIKSLELDKKNNENEIKNVNNINEMYKKKISELENNMNEIYLGEESKGGQLLELNEAKEAIDRLVLLLKNTEQYRKFGNFADDFKEIHYLKNITKRSKSNSMSFPEKRRTCSCCDIKIDERLVWSPTACYKILLEMKLKYEEMSEDCIEQSLFELNKIWLAKEEAHINKIKEQYEHQISKLKKKSQERYDQMVARKQIQRLKKELNDSKYSKKSNSPVTDNLDLLKNIGQYEDELRLKQRQIKLLQDRIKLMQTENNNYDKVLYLEGALWIIDKILDEIEQNNEDVHEFESKFRDNCQNLTTNQAWLGAFKEFFEAISELSASLVEKLSVMKDSTLKKMGNQRSQIRDSSYFDNSRKQ